MEDLCAEGIFLMFQVKGINNFWRHFPTEISFVRKKLCPKKPKNTLKNCIFWQSKNVTLGVFQKSRMSFFFVQNFHFSGCFWVFSNKNCFSTFMIFFYLLWNKSSIFSKSWKLQCFFSMWVFSKSPKSFLINYISIFKNKDTNLQIFFKVKCYRTKLNSENLVYW